MLDKDIESDMVNSSIPMDRLICGDVGFGKTEVAMRAAYRAFLSGRQVRFLDLLFIIIMKLIDKLCRRLSLLQQGH